MMDPANWIDAASGKPAASIPDKDTDIILPDADKPYVVAMGGKNYACRHLTIGRNATFSVYGGGTFTIVGNVWVRSNGKLSSWRTTIFAGDRHTFLRQAWPEDGKLKKLHDERLIVPYDPKLGTRAQPWWVGSVGSYVTHDKAVGKSTEVIGYANSGDEVGIKSGTFIVGRNSRFVSNGPATVAVNRGAKVVLMDGAMLAHAHNQFGTICMDCRLSAGGEITGGAPDRPLKRDAYLGIGYSNWMNIPVPEQANHKKKPEQKTGPKMYYGYGGQNARIDGDLIGYPAKGTDARLVVCWQRTSMCGAGSWGRGDEAFKKVFPKMPPKITIWISDKAKVSNTRFDDLHRGKPDREQRTLRQGNAGYS